MLAGTIIIGVLLPFVAIALGLLVPRSALSSVLILATFVASGALIRRWWMFAPSLASVIGLNLAERATPASRYGTAIEIHAGGFDPRLFAADLVRGHCPCPGWRGRPRGGLDGAPPLPED